MQGELTTTMTFEEWMSDQFFPGAARFYTHAPPPDVPLVITQHEGK